MEHTLPSSIILGASLSGNEYGWSIATFPTALQAAEALGYACLGGQFQFRTEDGTCEMYWVGADSREKLQSESWTDYTQGSCAEVSKEFERLIAVTDFNQLAMDWPSLRSHIADGFDPNTILVFVDYFVTESELAELHLSTRSD